MGFQVHLLLPPLVMRYCSPLSLPCLHLVRIRGVAIYIMIVYQQTVMYSSCVLIPHSSNTFFTFGYSPVLWARSPRMPPHHQIGCADMESI